MRIRLNFAAAAGAALALAVTGSLPTPVVAADAPVANVAVVIRDISNPYWRALRDGAVDQGKKMGVKVTVQAGPAETDSAGENAIIATMANQPYTCMAVTPINSTNVITPLIPVANKGTPVLILDNPLDPEAVKQAGLKITGFIGSDNQHAGRIAGEYMLKKLGDKGQVAILEGIPGEQNGINRETAFRATVKGKLEVTQAVPADYDRSKGLDVATAMLQAHPYLAGIFSANDTMGLGAVQAALNAGKDQDFTIISVDGIHEALESVAAGRLAGTISQYPYAEGQMAVQACQLLAEGKPIPAHVEAPIKLITADNVQQALASFPRPFFAFDDPFGEP